jgi:hypothetical protein
VGLARRPCGLGARIWPATRSHRRAGHIAVPAVTVATLIGRGGGGMGRRSGQAQAPRCIFAGLGLKQLPRCMEESDSPPRAQPLALWPAAITPVGSLMLDCLCGLDWADCMHSGHTRDFERLGDRGHPYDAEFSLLPQLAKVRIGVHACCAAPRRTYPFRCVRRRCCGTPVCLAAASMRLVNRPLHGRTRAWSRRREGRDAARCALVLFLARLLCYSTTRSRDYGRIEAPDSPSQCWSTACNTRQGCAAPAGAYPTRSLDRPCGALPWGVKAACEEAAESGPLRSLGPLTRTTRTPQAPRLCIRIPSPLATVLCGVRVGVRRHPLRRQQRQAHPTRAEDLGVLADF